MRQDVYTTGGQNLALSTNECFHVTGSWNLRSRLCVRKEERGALGWGVTQLEE